jgi:hypothetical protein
MQNSYEESTSKMMTSQRRGPPPPIPESSGIRPPLPGLRSPANNRHRLRTAMSESEGASTDDAEITDSETFSKKEYCIVLNNY